ncbi:MAG: PhoH family protein [Deltaproteobacteria bacterium]|nr:PhoH family protein [Deltaproteobacteria bacterium]
MANGQERGADPNKKSNRANANAQVEINDPAVMMAITGARNDNLRALEQEASITIGMRGNQILLQGPADEVAFAERVLAELVSSLRDGNALGPNDVARAARLLREHPGLRLKDVYDDVVLVSARHRVIAPKGLAQKKYIEAIRSHDVVFGIGPAGTGKTYLAMAMAVAALMQRQVKRIILTRPAVEAGEKLGFLPGDLAEKVNPYLRPLYDALHDMMDFDKAQALIQRGQIEVAPLAFMRGRTLNDSFVIMDEAQNTTAEQMKMFLTRLGMESKAVITGDVTQVDLPRGQKSGLSDAVQLLSGVEGIKMCTFTSIDVVRHPLVGKIVEAYEARTAAIERARAMREEHDEQLREEHDARVRAAREAT